MINLKFLFFGLLGVMLLGGLVATFDQNVAIGLMLSCLLAIATFVVLFAYGIKDRRLFLIFAIVFLIHLAAVLFIYWTDFRPFGGGADFEGYNQSAIEISQRLNRGNFSLQGIPLLHYFPVLIGIVYAVAAPKMIVGQLFEVWLAAFSVMLLYFLILEISSSKKAAFIIGLIASLYPSYLYFGSLLLKDTVVIPLVVGGLLLCVKMVKNFTVLKFITFFVVLTCAIHLRFYVGFALMFSFIISWFLLSKFELKRRTAYGAAMVFILGFSPMFLNYGYYGTKPLLGYINPKTITSYREVVYAPPPEPVIQQTATQVAVKTQPGEPSLTSNSQSGSQTEPVEQEAAPQKEAVAGNKEGYGSSFIIKAGFENPFTFIRNYIVSFLCALLGPFPWQLRYKRHLFFLIETIPWYACFCFIIYGAYKYIKTNKIMKFLEHYKYALPSLLFCAMALGALSLFINNYGIIVRIRMPMFLALLSVMSLSFDFERIKLFFDRYL